MKSELIKKLMETWKKKSYQKRVDIFDEPFSPRPKGHMWRILIPFDRFTYPIEFRLVRRNTLKTLKDLTLNAITSNVRNGLQIDKLELEVPDTLKMSMKQDCYARKQFQNSNLMRYLSQRNSNFQKFSKGNMKEGVRYK